MISVFMSESINVSYLFFGYIVMLPALIFFLSQRAISKRPGAFSAPDISNVPGVPPKNHYLLRLKDGSEKLIPLIPVSIIVALLIMTPGLLHLFFQTIPVYYEGKRAPPGFVPEGVSLEYEMSAVVSVMTIPIGIAIGLFILLYGRSIQKKRLRDNVVEIEDDLAVSLFQIANQFTENVPVEIGITKFVEHYDLLNLKKRQIYAFFSKVLTKMRSTGRTFSQAVFNSQEGVILEYPSVLLKEIMWIITESAKKGSEVVYNILMKVSIYLDNVRKIKELIYDLLHDTVTSIRFQARFMAPFISAMVASLTLVIVESLYRIFQTIQQLMKSLLSSIGGTAGGDFFTNMINFAKITPPTMFQTLVGIYLIEAVALLSILANGIENGADSLGEKYFVGQSLIKSTLIYIAIAFLVTLAFNFIASAIMGVSLSNSLPQANI